MPFPRFDRNTISFQPLSRRKNKVDIERDKIVPGQQGTGVEVDAVAEDIRKARERGGEVVLAFGAHAVKNGLGPVIIDLISRKWITHLATNGAGIIHDWELAFQGKTSEDVRETIRNGEFGAWEETGRYLNLALALGAYTGLGYGEAVGKMVEEDGLLIPSEEELTSAATENIHGNPERAAAAMDLLGLLRRNDLPAGFLKIEHPYRQYGIQAAAYRMRVPFTGHPMFGCDIIYEHPFSLGAAIGRTAERDFLSFAHTISSLQGGVYLSVGSAVMSPMIFEKSLSMARNASRGKRRPLDDFTICVVDLAKSTWDWQKDGEPPGDNPAYYLRYCKTFSRMGGRMRYITGDNRTFLPALETALST